MARNKMRRWRRIAVNFIVIVTIAATFFPIKALARTLPVDAWTAGAATDSCPVPAEMIGSEDDDGWSDDEDDFGFKRCRCCKSCDTITKLAPSRSPIALTFANAGDFHPPDQIKGDPVSPHEPPPRL